MEQSDEPDASRKPSGENATELTEIEWPSKVLKFPGHSDSMPWSTLLEISASWQ
jgi:hypothetical protein